MKDKIEQNPFLQTYTRQILTLSQRCAFLYNDDKSHTQAFRDDAVREFLTLAAYGQKEKVLALLEMHPKLLLESGIVQDYSGRKIEGTVYQILLGAEDVGMCCKLDRYFAVLTDDDGNLIGKEEKQRQATAQFPKVVNKSVDYELYWHDFSPLVDAIYDDPCKDGKPNEKTEAELIEFQKAFTPNPDHVIKTGKHFNMCNLVTAFNILNKKSSSWNRDQLSLFWRQAIGYLQRLAPACYAQAMCQGLYFVVQADERLKREFDLDKNAVYFPLDQNASLVLGRDFAVDVFNGRVRIDATCADDAPQLLQSLINRKHLALNHLRLDGDKTIFNPRKIP